MDNKIEQIRRLLDKYYQGTVRTNSLGGFVIVCPFHTDHSPSCNIYPSGVFLCWSCMNDGGKSPWEGFKLLGVPESEIRRVWGTQADQDDETATHTKIPSLDAMLEKEEGTTEETHGIETEEAWPEGWGFRGVGAAFFQDPWMQELFSPKLVRLWVKRQDKIMLERWPRLSLRLAGSDQGDLYLRLSNRQKIKVRNPGGLSLKNPKLMPFGLRSWQIKKVKGLILVEGPYDALRVRDNLRKLRIGEEWEVVALLGTSQWGAFRSVFEKRLLHQMSGKQVVLMFDMDAAGKSLTSFAKEQLQQIYMLNKKQIRVRDYDAGDPGDFGLDKGFEEWFLATTK